MTKTSEIRLQKAYEYFKEAEFLNSENIGNLAVLANLYHSMMNCLFALFDLKEPGNILHADIINRFKSDYVQQGIFDRKFSEALDFSFEITHECNCDHMKPPEEEDIDRLLPVAREFIQATKVYLENRL